MPENMSKTNRQFVLASRLSGYLKESDFGLVESPVSEPSDGQLLVRTIFLSVVPYMQGRMNNNRGSYEPPVENGQVMTSGIVSEVVKSKNPSFQEGEIVQGNLG
jgi:NADPH-dependent curcumin reductase CurA